MDGLMIRGRDNSLLPFCPASEAWLSKLKVGQVVSVTSKSVRNYLFLKKGFVLLRFAYDNWSTPGELLHNGKPVLRSFEKFREEITVLAGHYDQVWNLDGNLTLEAKSWSFAKCDEEDFEVLYKNILTVTWEMIFQKSHFTSQDEIENIVQRLLEFE